MPEIIQVYQSTFNFNDTEWATDWIYVADAPSISYVANCNKDCSFGIRWAVDGNNEVIAIDSDTLTANQTKELSVSVKAKLAQFYVNTFQSLPCVLKTQALSYDSYLNSGGGGGGGGGGGDVSLISSGATGSYSLVNDSTGPILAVKGITGATGISLTYNASNISISSTFDNIYAIYWLATTVFPNGSAVGYAIYSNFVETGTTYAPTSYIPNDILITGMALVPHAFYGWTNDPNDLTGGGVEYSFYTMPPNTNPLISNITVLPNSPHFTVSYNEINSATKDYNSLFKPLSIQIPAGTLLGLRYVNNITDTGSRFSFHPLQSTMLLYRNI